METIDIITCPLAHYCIQRNRHMEYYLLRLFHEDLRCPRESTKDLVSNIAIILMDFYSISYLKYTN